MNNWTLKSLEWLRKPQLHLVWSKQGKDSEQDLCFLYSVQESKSSFKSLLWAVQNTPLGKVRLMINSGTEGQNRGGQQGCQNAPQIWNKCFRTFHRRKDETKTAWHGSSSTCRQSPDHRLQFFCSWNQQLWICQSSNIQHKLTSTTEPTPNSACYLLTTVD